MKGKYVDSDPEKAFFYFRLASLEICDCGSLADMLHSKRICEVHFCVNNMACEYIKSMAISEFERRKFEDKFISYNNLS